MKNKLLRLVLVLGFSTDIPLYAHDIGALCRTAYQIFYRKASGLIVAQVRGRFNDEQILVQLLSNRNGGTLFRTVFKVEPESIHLDDKLFPECTDILEEMITNKRAELDQAQH